MTFQPFQPFNALRPFRTSIGLSKLAALIKALFGDGEAGGMWLVGPQYCYTDDGITNCTAPGDLVYRVDDISGNGNHARQATAAARPALGRTVEGGRRNLFQPSEPSLAQARTVLGGVTDAVTAIEGFQQTLQFSTGSAETQLAYLFVDTATAKLEPSTIYTISFFVQMDDGSAPVPGLSGQIGSDFTLAIDADPVPPEDTSVVSVGNGVYRVSGVATSRATPNNNPGGVIQYSNQSDKGFRCAGFQIEAGTTLTAYQRVGTTALDVTEAGKSEKWYLKDDGIDDSLVATFAASLGTTCTTNIATSAGITTLAAQTVGTTYDIMQSTEVFGAIVTDDALTTDEQSKIDAFLGGRHP